MHSCLKICSHVAIATAISLSQLMGCMVFTVQDYPTYPKHSIKTTQSQSETRMHSSRMRTAQITGRLFGGGEVSAQRVGVSARRCLPGGVQTPPRPRGKHSPPPSPTDREADTPLDPEADSLPAPLHAGIHIFSTQRNRNQKNRTM